jgi:hypothetical protein
MASSAGLRRQNSARDKSKKIPDLSRPHPRPNTSHLVVCGAEVEKDVWLFGDFLGFTSALREQSPPVNGTFISCFDFTQYFLQNPSYKDVKFGRRPEIGDEKWDNGDEIAVYTKFDFEHRTRWWIQLDQQERRTLIPRVLEWIRNRVQDAKSGDIVSIILIGHGNPRGIVLGGETLETSDLVAACSNFALDVQVNIVIKACYSGAFAKAFKVSNQRNIYIHTSAKHDESSWSARRSISGRLRNSLFGAAFVRTFGLMRDPDEIWTLEKQASLITSELNAPEVPLKRRSTPQVISDSPMTRLMMDIMHRDYVDITFRDAPVRARRVLTPKNDALVLLSQPIPTSRRTIIAEFEAASNVFHNEMGLINTDWPHPDDIGITTDWINRYRAPNRAGKMIQLVQALAFRFKIQEYFLITVEYLIRLELLSLDALYIPMNLSTLTPSVQSVIEALQCFSFAQECMSRAGDSLAQPFESPVKWLATVIVRSCADWTRIFNRLCTVQMLGAPIDELVTSLSEKRLRFTVNLDEAKDAEVETLLCGFWLPHGIKIKDFCKTWSVRYLSMIATYEGVTKNKWPDSHVQAAVSRLLEMEIDHESRCHASMTASVTGATHNTDT